MKYAITILLAFLFSFHSQGQIIDKFNLSFEEYEVSKILPDDWFQWGSYDLGMDTEAHSGKYAAMITSPENGTAFGSIAYKIPANYKGSSIRLEGYMKLENVKDGFGGLLLRIDGNGASLAFDNMQTQNINGTKDWAKYSVELPYPEGAELIFVAGIMTGSGKAWFDDFTLTIDGKDIQTLKEAPQPIFKANLDKEFDKGSNIELPELDENKIANLELLGRVWGFLKYHHPVIAKGDYNWDYELFRVLPSYIKAKDTAERDQILLKWIDKYGKIAKCKACKETPATAFAKPDLSWMKKSGVNAKLEKKLNHIYLNRHQGKQFYIGMASGVGNPQFLNEKSYKDLYYPDEGFRLLTVYKYWNMINYFFPYQHLMDKDWNDVLSEYIPIFMDAKNKLEYEQAAVRIIGDIQDTHANLWSGNGKMKALKGNYYPPFHVRFIEDQLVVTDYYNPELKGEAELKVGDVITHIDGKTIESIINEIKIYYPASNDAARMRDISADLLRSLTRSIDVNYISNDEKKEKELILYHKEDLKMYSWYKTEEGKSYKYLEDDIGYVSLGNIKAEDVIFIKQFFNKQKGIIIDIRNYPATFVPFSLGSYFMTADTPFVKFTSGNFDNPGEFTFGAAIEIPKSDKPYKGKVIVIVNELSQSQAEYTAMAFRAGVNTTIIGSTTAGADGNVSRISLPGGLRTMISGIGVYYPDGTETQRVGVVPDVIVKPTIEGIKNGRDELLEKAIELIKE
jgi:C-terminal processing protease CtpA/Prc